MKLSFSLLVLLFTLALPTQAQVNEWYQYKSEEFGYSISFPGEPEAMDQKVPSAIGELTLNIQYFAETNEGAENFMYMTNCTTYPDGALNLSDSTGKKDFFDGAVNGATTNVNGELISQKKIMLDGHEGREMMVEIQEGTVVVLARLYLVGNRMYMLQTMTQKGNENNKITKEFMDSFKFIKK
ncbi:MAG: PsbP-related protein [Bacteroidota bacterium]